VKVRRVYWPALPVGQGARLPCGSRRRTIRSPASQPNVGVVAPLRAAARGGPAPVTGDRRHAQLLVSQPEAADARAGEAHRAERAESSAVPPGAHILGRRRCRPAAGGQQLVGRARATPECRSIQCFARRGLSVAPRRPTHNAPTCRAHCTVELVGRQGAKVSTGGDTPASHLNRLTGDPPALNVTDATPNTGS
jgi:hypothetical protein